MSDIHPLGKSPLLELDYRDGEETKKIAESGLIITYLIKHFDTDGILKPINEEDEEEAEYYLHFSEGTLQPLLTYTLLHEIAYSRTRESAKPAIDTFLDRVDGSYTTPNLFKAFDSLEQKLKKRCEELEYTSSSKEIFFVGHKLSAADIILEFNASLAFRDPELIKPIHRSKYVYLSKWLSQIKQRPAFVRSVDKIQKMGNDEYTIYY